MRDVAGEEDSSPVYLTFHLGEQTLGIDVRDVRELLVPGKITPLPDAPICVLGVVDLRGTPLPVVDLKAHLDIPSTASTHEPQILVVEVAAGSHRKLLGILVDGVGQVDEIPADKIQPCPSIGISNWDSSIIEGLSLREAELVVLIRIDRIFGDMMDELALDGPPA
ncbi:chemotaxis protein CheW [Palleronia marisminoris]|uniref:chemotaxis protein CheW n=1 Tax=Palleronia marisminoris TaxID=315423 RepID=UPI0015877B29|nr:chemotaxis protein CheW [Palleronia marisminoris]